MNLDGNDCATNSAPRSPVVAFLDPLTAAFTTAGKTLYLVGGIVRGLALGEYSSRDDLDLTTDARPPEIKAIIEDVVTSVWTQGERYGTIGARFKGRPIEITTHRAESYNTGSRKPEVRFGHDLETDLSRRDFTINAMALSLPAGRVIDPFGGREDLKNRQLRTPVDPAISFADDPLRILRAARFITRLNLTATTELESAAKGMVERLEIVSVERIQIEIELLLAQDDPSAGIEFLHQVGVMAYLFGSLASDESRVAASQSGLSPLLRRAALLGHAGPDSTRQWLADHRYSAEERQSTTSVVAGAHHLAGVVATEPGVREFVSTTGIDRLAEVFELARLRSDIYADPAPIERIFLELSKTEDLQSLGSPLSGNKIMEVLQIEQSRAVGAATKYLARQRIEQGPMSKEQAIELLKAWWKDAG